MALVLMGLLVASTPTVRPVVDEQAPCELHARLDSALQAQELTVGPGGWVLDVRRDPQGVLVRLRDSAGLKVGERTVTAAGECAVLPRTIALLVKGWVLHRLQGSSPAPAGPPAVAAPLQPAPPLQPPVATEAPRPALPPARLVEPPPLAQPVAAGAEPPRVETKPAREPSRVAEPPAPSRERPAEPTAAAPERRPELPSVERLREAQPPSAERPGATTASTAKPSEPPAPPPEGLREPATASAEQPPEASSPPGRPRDAPGASFERPSAPPTVSAERPGQPPTASAGRPSDPLTDSAERPGEAPTASARRPGDPPPSSTERPPASSTEQRREPPPSSTSGPRESPTASAERPLEPPAPVAKTPGEPPEPGTVAPPPTDPAPAVAASPDSAAGARPEPTGVSRPVTAELLGGGAVGPGDQPTAHGQLAVEWGFSEPWGVAIDAGLQSPRVATASPGSVTVVLSFASLMGRVRWAPFSTSSVLLGLGARLTSLSASSSGYRVNGSATFFTGGPVLNGEWRQTLAAGLFVAARVEAQLRVRPEAFLIEAVGTVFTLPILGLSASVGGGWTFR